MMTNVKSWELQGRSGKKRFPEAPSSLQQKQLEELKKEVERYILQSPPERCSTALKAVKELRDKRNPSAIVTRFDITESYLDKLVTHLREYIEYELEPEGLSLEFGLWANIHYMMEKGMCGVVVVNPETMAKHVVVRF